MPKWNGEAKPLKTIESSWIGLEERFEAYSRFGKVVRETEGNGGSGEFPKRYGVPFWEDFQGPWCWCFFGVEQTIMDGCPI